jgi:anaerobic magnesium-protoporphyrin IX monomethyl ester cyclase
VRILLVNPPYQTLTSNLGVGHQVPLGLLAVGGPLLEAGHDVRLLDAECLHLNNGAIARAVHRLRPDAVMTGRAGSTPAHPICLDMFRAIKRECPEVLTVYGGVYPSYHAQSILAGERAVDVIVRGEGEASAAALAGAMHAAGSHAVDGLESALAGVPGLAFRARRGIILTPDRPPIQDLDQYRVGWDLIKDWDRYTCFGLGRAAILQFSRGCPHRCTYCGQHEFWVRWRHRHPVRFAHEVERLHRDHGVRFITLADENPTTLQPVWRRLLEELAGRRLPVHFFATIRAGDIVRDAGLLPLYRAAGILYVLMGIESTDAGVLRSINKGSTPEHDIEACRLLKAHGIFSILGHIVGFQNETFESLRAGRKRLARYQGDWLNAMYVTPHDWTPFGADNQAHVIEADQVKWDYRHQVVRQKHLRPWQLFLWVKWLELWFHLRPGRIRRLLTGADRFKRRQVWWVFLHIGLVWLGEIVEFLSGKARRRKLKSRRRLE